MGSSAMLIAFSQMGYDAYKKLTDEYVDYENGEVIYNVDGSFKSTLQMWMEQTSIRIDHLVITKQVAHFRQPIFVDCRHYNNTHTPWGVERELLNYHTVLKVVANDC